MRRGVTLIELLFVVTILVILAAVAFGVYAAAVAQARVNRTQVIVAKLNQLITAKWENYRTRAVPIRIPPGMRPVGEPFTDTLADADLTNGVYDGSPETFIDQAWRDENGDGVPDLNGKYDIGATELRLYALRELMRCELPNLKADVLVDPTLIVRPALSKNYLRRASPNWSDQYEGAECLYLIVAAMRDSEDSALSYFSPSEIGDVDGDGMQEILDGFGQPIEFIRWPAGYSEQPGPDGQWGVAGVDDDGNFLIDDAAEAGWPGSDDVLPPPTPQTRNYQKAPDPFDPMGADGRTRLPNLFIVPFALQPLIYSPGPNKEYDIQKLRLPNATAAQLRDPYRVEFNGTPPRLSAGSPYDPDSVAGFADNITNHAAR